MVSDVKAHEARLRRLIARGLKMEKLKKRLKDQLDILDANVQELMEDLELKRYVGSTGEALVVPSQTREWDMDKLEDVLTRKQWKRLCPPKPDGAALSGHLKSLANDLVATEKLMTCCEVTPKPFVRLADPKEVKDRVEKPVTERDTRSNECVGYKAPMVDNDVRTGPGRVWSLF